MALLGLDREKLYTIRWTLRNKLSGSGDDIALIEKLLAELLGETKPSPEPPVDEERPNTGEPNGEKLLYYPLALRDGLKPMKTVGEYPKGYPEGLVVHWTSGHWDASIKDQVANAAPYCYFVIDNKGQVAQAFALNRWGSHAGTSKWKGRTTISNYFVGCEVMCAGKVEKKSDQYMTWFGREVPKDQVVFSKNDGNIQQGYYQRYTKDQFGSLVALIMWLKGNNPEVFDLDNVVGHDEIAPERKCDPGASLVRADNDEILNMEEFREYLKKKWSAILIAKRASLGVSER